MKVKHNPTFYELIGRGTQGAVFKLTSDKCVKVYHSKDHKRREENVLILAESSPYFPKLFEAGKYYIVMEYVDGITLEKYLEQERKLSREITEQIISLIKDMKRLNIPRRDPKLRHMIMNKENKIKVIDHVNSLKKKHKPERLFEGLQDLHLLKTFLGQVKEIDNELYKEWKTSMRSYF